MKHFKTYPLNRLVSNIALLSFFIAIIFFSCKKDENADDNSNSSTTEITVSIFGSVRDENGVALSGVTLKAGTSTITSDANGLFILEKVKVPKGRYYVSAEKSGYFDSGRGGLAKEGEYYSVNIVMLSRGTAVNLNAATGGVVNTANNSSLSFPTGAIVTAGGQAYTGNVKVYSQYLMPGTASFEDRIPGGDLAYLDANGELSPLVSYGMIGVELEDNSGNPLNIATGKTVSVRFPIATSQLATAPASIPLLSFDTDKGVWIQEGTAIKNGNYYEGEVSHFSWWNCDVLNNPPPPLISGSVVDCNGTPLSGVIVTVNGMYNIVTNSQGQYSSWIIPGIFTLQVLSIYNGGFLNSNPVIISVSSGNISVPVLTVPCPAYVSAQALDCNNNNTLAYGRAVWSGGASNVQVSTSGGFKFAVPANLSITVQLFDGKANANTIITSGNLNTTVSAGNVILCNLGGGGNCAGGPTSVTDIDGNVYNVVTVGNQCWMKENLKTTKYKNGTVIPGSLSDAAWSNTTSGAQADYNNDAAYTNIYGKLYNWYAVADPAGLCPTGWHIPSKSEWHELTKFLDPSADTILLLQSTIAGGLLKSNGNLQDGTGIWEAPNTDATNTTGFTGLPAGVRDTTGTYADIGVAGYWWSSSPFSTNESWSHYVMYSNGWIARHFPPNNCGYSVRCLRN